MSDNGLKCFGDRVLIPAGSFVMGSTEGDPDEKPVREVYLDTFCIDKHPVTLLDYVRYLGEIAEGRVYGGRCENSSEYRGCRFRKLESRNDELHNQFIMNELQKVLRGESFYVQMFNDRWPAGLTLGSGLNSEIYKPITGVNWVEAGFYCRALGEGHLPTEAQWEKAAKGGIPGAKYATSTGRLYSENSRTWGFSVFRGKKLAPVNTWEISTVCSFPPNGYGLCDMSGNVWEWTEDVYLENGYSVLPLQNPRNSAGLNEERVLRGGYYGGADNKGEYFSRVSNRAFIKETNHGARTGFRCASEPLRVDSDQK